MEIDKYQTKQYNSYMTKHRHKWEVVSMPNTFYSKREKCIKCGIERTWLYGHWKCWEYIDFRLPIGDGRISLYKPSCTPELLKGITSISRKGVYI